MSEITINSKQLKSDISPAELIFLKCIYEFNKRFFKDFCSIYGSKVSLLANNLEKKLYIKITGDDDLSLDSYSVRDKGMKLFEVKEIENTITEIITYLNYKCNKTRGFNIESKGNRKFISARLKEGYEKKDLIDVIDVKVEEWLNTDQEFYLRPQTLFNDEKFQSYINQVDRSKSNKDDWTIDKA